MGFNKGIRLPLVSMRQIEFMLGKSRQELHDIAACAGRYYKPFDRRSEIGKGKWRHIDNPKGELKLLQKKIQKHILSKITLPETMVGGVPGKSIRNNAKFHEGQLKLVTLDLKNCFPRTNDLKVFKAYREILGCSPQIASLLTKLTTFQKRLPQGAPTSSLLANFTLLPMHDEICAIAERFNLQWSIYVDDIAFSGFRAFDAIDEVIHTIQKHGHSVGRRKTKLMSNNMPQKLTGIIVNRKASIEMVKRKELARTIFDLSCQPDIPDRKLKSIRSHIAFVSWINPTQGASLQRLADRYLPKTGVDGPKKRTDEIRPCRNSRRDHSGR